MKQRSLHLAQGSLTHRLAEAQQYCRHLEKVAARYGSDDRWDVHLDLEAVRREIVTLQATRTALAPRQLTADVDDSPPRQSILREQITEALTCVRHSLPIVMGELVYLPLAIQTTLHHRLESSALRLQDLEDQWAALDTQPATSVTTLQAFLRSIWQFHASLHLLELREIHRRRLTLMERQQLAQHSLGVHASIRDGLAADIQTAKRAITALQRKWRATPHDRTLLAIHTENLRWNEEILAGERPYTSVGLLRQMQEEARAIGTIDAQLSHDNAAELHP